MFRAVDEFLRSLLVTVMRWRCRDKAAHCTNRSADRPDGGTCSSEQLVPTRGIVQVWGGCGWGWYPVPGHWRRWRGGWVPHIVRRTTITADGGPYGGWGTYGARQGPYGGWRPNGDWGG